MTLWAAAAIAGPVLGDVGAPDAFARCLAAADAEIDAPLGQAALENAGKIALVVGVPCHKSEQVPSLQYSTRDATEMGHQLAAAGFTVVPLLSSVDRRQLFDALDQIERSLPADGELVVYFSGHGTLREESGQLRRYLVMSDTDLGAVHTTGVAVRTLEERISQIEALSRVVIQDTCFADTPVGNPLERGKGILPIEPGLALAAGDLRLYGSRFFEQAVESVELRGSVYTYHLLGALAEPQADLDGDGCVALLEAHAWARERVVTARAGSQVPQVRTPVGSPLQLEGNLALACAPGQPQRAVLATPTDDRWSISVSDRQGEPISGRSLEPGRYHLVVSELVPDERGDLAREVRLDGPLHVKAGEWVDVVQRLDDQRALRWAELVVQGAFTDELPAGGLGVKLGLALPDRGHGRLMVAAGGLHRVGPNDLRASELDLSLGYQRTLAGPGVALLGPVITAGPLARTPGVTAENPYHLDTHVGAFAELALRGSYAKGGLAMSLEAGVRALPLARDGGIPLHWLPLLSLGVGPGL